MDHNPASKKPGLFFLLIFAVVVLVQAVSQPQVPFTEHRLKNGLVSLSPKTTLCPSWPCA